MAKAYFIGQESGQTYPIHENRWKGNQDELLDIKITTSFDPETLKNQPINMWRYQAVFPWENMPPAVSFGEGFTPLIEETFGKHKVWLKLEYLFPSGSYKDRGAALILTQAKALGLSRVIQDSSGNAGCAIAQYAAKADINCQIFVPDSTSPAKLAQIEMTGATLVKVPGSREDTAQAAWQAAQSDYYASHVWNPFFHQGTKTFAYEICEQLNWQAPDTLVLPAGNGTLLIGAYLGFEELVQMGIIPRIPKIIAIQAANCAPLYEAFRLGKEEGIHLQSQKTLAEGIAIALPRRGRQMLQYVRNTNGQFIAVEEPPIQEALIELARKGYYVEPTSAAIIAGMKIYLQTEAQKDEKVLSLLTGHGLKSTEKMLQILKTDLN